MSFKLIFLIYQITFFFNAVYCTMLERRGGGGGGEKLVPMERCCGILDLCPHLTPWSPLSSTCEMKSCLHPWLLAQFPGEPSSWLSLGFSHARSIKKKKKKKTKKKLMRWVKGIL